MSEGAGSGSHRARPAAFHPEADAEMRAAARYYEEHRAGLGGHFLDEVERAVAFAAAHPLAGTAIEEGFRWVLTRRFGYAVIYREHGEPIRSTRRGPPQTTT
ncbi:MAG: type II toxin-antitoxin system RelE/ParE family toxin [Gemmatimonadota bacterium]|nr:type II toxin-antitoxin system RelE/ParE family toxin [Gemmatimonadota bacterium]